MGRVLVVVTSVGWWLRELISCSKKCSLRFAAICVVSSLTDPPHSFSTNEQKLNTPHTKTRALMCVRTGGVLGGRVHGLGAALLVLIPRPGRPLQGAAANHGSAAVHGAELWPGLEAAGQGPGRHGTARQAPRHRRRVCDAQDDGGDGCQRRRWRRWRRSRGGGRGGRRRGRGARFGHSCPCP